jgi:predicted amidohydrolase
VPVILFALVLTTYLPNSDARHLAAYTKIASEDGKQSFQLVTLAFRQPDPGPFALLAAQNHDPYWNALRLRAYWLRVGPDAYLGGPNVPDVQSFSNGVPAVYADRVTFRLPGDLDLTKLDWHVYTRRNHEQKPGADLPGNVRFRVMAADLAAVNTPFWAEVRDVEPRCDAIPNDSNGRFKASIRFNYWPVGVDRHRVGGLESVKGGSAFRGAHEDWDADARNYEYRPGRDWAIAVSFKDVEGWFPAKRWGDRTGVAASPLRPVGMGEAPGAAKMVRVAAVQCSSALGDVEGNTKKLTRLTWVAARNGAKFVVLPETAITGYLSQDLKTNWHLKDWPIEAKFVGKDPKGFAEEVPGPSTKHFCALAKELGIYLTIPLLEVDFAKGKDKPRYFNTVCLANPKGELVAHYRKLTPWPFPEKSWATAGDRGVQAYDTEYGRVGLGICFDIHTILEKYEAHNIWCLLYPIAWVDTEHPAEWMFHRLPERVKPFKHHLVGANWSVDEKQQWRGYGFSVIISNEGNVVASAKSLYGSEIVYAELPTAK